MNKIIVSIITSILLFGCGDNPTSPNNPPPTDPDSLIMEFDSLSIYGQGQADTLIGNLINFHNDSLKITFTSETNCNVLDTMNIRIKLGGFTFFIQDYLQLNANHIWRTTLYFDYIFDMSISIFSQTNHYLKIKNIKLYKVI